MALFPATLFTSLAEYFRSFFSDPSFRYFPFRHRETTPEAIREITYTYDDLARNVVGSLLDVFPTDMAAVYFYNGVRKELQLRAQQGMKQLAALNLPYNRGTLSMSQSDPLVQYISDSKAIVRKDFLLNKENPTTFEQAVVQSLDRIEAEVCAPIFFAGQIKGVLTLGKKRSGATYTATDDSVIFAFGHMGEEVVRYMLGMETELNHTALYSHDMNNDTKSLVQTLEFLQSPMAAKAPRDKILLLLKQAEDVAVRLNHTFLLNRDRSSLIMRSMRGDYQRMPVDFTGIIRTSIAKFFSEADKQGVLIVATLPDKHIVVSGNPDDLERVIDNLLAYALRYVGPDGRIEVNGRLVGSNFELTICDNGQGIPADDIERLWTLGWQVRDAKEGASGFGLSIARQIIHLHGGTIDVVSGGKTQGATFAINIPLMDNEKQEIHET